MSDLSEELAISAGETALRGRGVHAACALLAPPPGHRGSTQMRPEPRLSRAPTWHASRARHSCMAKCAATVPTHALRAVGFGTKASNPCPESNGAVGRGFCGPHLRQGRGKLGSELRTQDISSINRSVGYPARTY